MNDHLPNSARTSFFSSAAKAAKSASNWIDARTVRGRAVKRAERMMMKSDAELTALGLKRDNILQHAFSRYAG